MPLFASRPIARIQHLSAFLEGQGEAVIGLGRKRSGARAWQLASKSGLLWLLLEDGFIHSVRLVDTSVSLINFATDHSSLLAASVSTEGLDVSSDARRIAYTEGYKQCWLDIFNARTDC